MEAMIRIQAKREIEGKESRFEVRGSPVDPEKIKRYMKRKKDPESLLTSPPSPTAGE